MKIFISHKKEDANTAARIKRTLDNHNIDAYLVLLDNSISNNGERLTKHIRSKISECSDIIAVLSEETRKSWWVPFEIGMATEQDMPIANSLVANIALPEYLEYWPRLKDQDDVRKYVTVRQRVTKKYKERGIFESSSVFGVSETEEFYQQLKKIL